MPLVSPFPHNLAVVVRARIMGTLLLYLRSTVDAHRGVSLQRGVLYAPGESHCCIPIHEKEGAAVTRQQATGCLDMPNRSTAVVSPANTYDSTTRIR